MRVHHTVCCGIDVHKKSVTACLMWGAADQEPECEIRRFGTMTFATEGISRMAQKGGLRNGRDGKHRSLLETRMECFRRRDSVDPGECETCSSITGREDG